MKTATAALILNLVALAAIAIDGKGLHHKQSRRTLRGRRRTQGNRGVPRRATDPSDKDEDNELGNGTGAGFVRGIGTVTQSVCPICVCYQPCTIQFNTIVIGDSVSPETIEAVLKAQHQQAGDGQNSNSNLETLLGGGAQERPPPDAGEVTVPGEALLNEEVGEAGMGTSASNSCELQCKMQCAHNCGSTNGVALAIPSTPSTLATSTPSTSTP